MTFSSKSTRVPRHGDVSAEPPPTVWGWVNVKWGIREGWWFAKRYLVYAIVVMAVGGPTLLKRNHVAVIGVVATYVLGIPSIGAIVGALRPLCRTSFGAAFVGIVAMMPIAVAVVMMVASPSDDGLGLRIGATLALSVIYGAVGGLYMRGVYNR